MYNFKNWRRTGLIMETDVRNLRDELHVGDYVWEKTQTEQEYFGRIRIGTKFRKGMVLAKFPNLVVVSGKGTKVNTMTYKDILLHELERKRKLDERSMGERLEH